METAGGALKFETAIAGRIKRIRLGGGACHQFHLGLVKLVDQHHEACSFVAVLR